MEMKKLIEERKRLNLKPRKVSGKTFDSLNWAVKKITNINSRTTVFNIIDGSVVTYYYE